MGSQKDIWADSVLQAAESIERAKAPDGFYTRTLSRIKSETTYTTGVVLKVAASVLLLVAINVSTCLSTDKSATQNQQAIESFANDYSLTGNSYNF